MGRFLTSFALDAPDGEGGTMLGLAQPRNALLPKLYTDNYYMLPRPNDPSIAWGPHHCLILLAKGDFGLFDLGKTAKSKK